MGLGVDVTRMGYGAMQLAGPGVMGPPKDREGAVAVLRTAVEMGINHIDTSDYYGPHITNQIIKEALHPYGDDLQIVTKVGAKRNAKGGWPQALSRDELRQAVFDNLTNLDLEVINVVNLRVGGQQAPLPGSIAAPFEALLEMQHEGYIEHIGLSNVNAEQITEAQGIGSIVCVQNFYNIANRKDDEIIDSLAEQNIAYVPFFPLGGFSPLQSETLNAIAKRLESTPNSVALAWLLQRSPNICLIPGTSSVEHLRENVSGAAIELSADVVAELDSIGA